MMMLMIILSTVIGGVLGIRFKILALVPAFLIAIALSAATTFARNGNVWSALIAIALTVTGLQVGFLVGIATQHVIAAARALHSRAAADRPRGAVSGSLPAE